MQKTNAIRILESASIKFRVIEYESNEDELDAISVAKKIGMPPEQVFKTLVAISNDKEYLVFVLPGNLELNLKKAANAANKKNVELIPVKSIEQVTGYIRGGCSPIGMKKQFKTFIDETALLFDEISISAGKRGMQIIINPQDLLKITKSELKELTWKKDSLTYFLYLV